MTLVTWYDYGIEFQCHFSYAQDHFFDHKEAGWLPDMDTFEWFVDDVDEVRAALGLDDDEDLWPDVKEFVEDNMEEIMETGVEKVISGKYSEWESTNSW
jgi:hypothetical protein